MLRYRVARAFAVFAVALAFIAAMSTGSRAQTTPQAASVRTVALTVDSVTDSVRVALVPPNFIAASQMRAFLGRAFLPGDFAAPVRSVAVISHRLWLRRFGAQPTVIGTDVRVDGRRVVIVGVAPKGIDFPGDAALIAPTPSPKG